MADPKNTSPNEGPPGEVRSNLQVVVRVVLVIVVLALLIGLGVALVRLLNRPDVVDAALSAAAILPLSLNSAS